MASQSPKPARSSKGKILVAAIALTVVIGAAVLELKPGPSPVAEPPIDVQATSIQGAPPMPAWLVSAEPMTKTEYMWAAAHLEELQYIPCYCGCGANGHADNFACYYSRDAAGNITGYDQMSFG